ncbi:MAG: hypothetical protein IJX18_00080, partial [Clostridia bacterium]|nr:hypothetical protein [Clostridia bacterium]
MEGSTKRKNVFYRLAEAFRRGSLATKLSFFMLGGGQLMHRQYIKGALYFLVQVLFILFLTFFGGGYLLELFSGNLGTKVSG